MSRAMMSLTKLMVVITLMVSLLVVVMMIQMVVLAPTELKVERVTILSRVVRMAEPFLRMKVVIHLRKPMAILCMTQMKQSSTMVTELNLRVKSLITVFRKILMVPLRLRTTIQAMGLTKEQTLFQAQRFWSLMIRKCFLWWNLLQIPSLMSGGYLMVRILLSVLILMMSSLVLIIFLCFTVKVVTTY